MPLLLCVLIMMINQVFECSKCGSSEGQLPPTINDVEAPALVVTGEGGLRFPEHAVARWLAEAYSGSDGDAIDVRCLCCGHTEAVSLGGLLSGVLIGKPDTWAFAPSCYGRSVPSAGRPRVEPRVASG